MKGVLISGSLAYDNLMYFDGDFSKAILPEAIGKLSVSFLASERFCHFGGCAGNIAFTLKKIGGEPYIFGVAGNDFTEYHSWLNINGVVTDYIEIDKNQPTAAAFILTDNGQRQITTFSPAAMGNKTLAMKFKKIDFEKIALAIIGPELPERMLNVATECRKYDLPYIFDPGQGLSILHKEQILEILNGAIGLIVNEYEGELVEKLLGLQLEQLAKENDIFVVQTLGERGARLMVKNAEREFAPLPAERVVNSTGCGDAFRSGFLYGYVEGRTLEVCCQMGNVAASYVLGQLGTQEHQLTSERFEKDFAKFYGGG